MTGQLGYWAVSFIQGLAIGIDFQRQWQERHGDAER